MKQEFISWRGKVIIEDDFLYIRSYYFFVNWQFIRLLFAIIFLVFFVVRLFDTPQDAEWKTRTYIWGLTVLALVLPALYETLFKHSYSNRIPIAGIKSFEIKKDAVGYKTFVILKLKSGRTRKIKFRTFENQHEHFVSILSTYISQPQIA